MTLMLHAGANPVEYDALRALETPAPTTAHVPIPHFRVVDLIAHSLAYFGVEPAAMREDGFSSEDIEATKYVVRTP